MHGQYSLAALGGTSVDDFAFGNAFLLNNMFVACYFSNGHQNEGL